MAYFNLPHFGAIDTEALKEYYVVEILFDSRQMQVDLHFENKFIDEKKLETVMHFIDNIRIHDINNKRLIEKDFRNSNGDTVLEYANHHLDELGELDLRALIDYKDKSIDHQTQLVKKLHLVRVGLYPDSEKEFAIFDYSIGQDLTNYLVVINTDENGNLDYMTMES